MSMTIGVAIVLAMLLLASDVGAATFQHDGKVAGGATDSLVQSLILLVLGAVLAGVGALPGLHLTAAKIVGALLILALTTSSLVSVGLIIGAFMESPEGFQFITSFVLFPAFFLSGALFPIEQLPAWLRPFVLGDPLTYAVDALRGVILGASHFPLALDVAVLAAFLAAGVAVGSWAFQRMSV